MKERYIVRFNRWEDAPGEIMVYAYNKDEAFDIVWDLFYPEISTITSIDEMCVYHA